MIAPWTTNPPNSRRIEEVRTVKRCSLIGAMVVLAGVLAGILTLSACATTGARTSGASGPETRALQQVEVDGSVRVRSNHYRGR
jgi:hypothetical protein